MHFRYTSLQDLVISQPYSDNDERLNGDVSNKKADSDIGSHKVQDGGGTEVDRNKK